LTFYKCSYSLSYSFRKEDDEIEEGSTKGDINTDDDFHTWTEGGKEITYTRFQINVSNPASNCFSGDSLVQLSDGSWCPVKSLQVGQFVAGCGQRATRVECIWHMQMTTDQTMVDLSHITGGRTLLIKDDHPVHMIDQQWVHPSSVGGKLVNAGPIDIWNVVLEGRQALNLSGVAVATVGMPVASFHQRENGLESTVTKWKARPDWPNISMHEIPSLQTLSKGSTSTRTDREAGRGAAAGTRTDREAGQGAAAGPSPPVGALAPGSAGFPQQNASTSLAAALSQVGSCVVVVGTKSDGSGCGLDRCAHHVKDSGEFNVGSTSMRCDTCNKFFIPSQLEARNCLWSMHRTIRDAEGEFTDSGLGKAQPGEFVHSNERSYQNLCIPRGHSTTKCVIKFHPGPPVN